MSVSLPEPAAVPVSHVEHVAAIISELLDVLGRDRCVSFYSVVPLAAQTLGLDPPPHAQPGSRFVLDAAVAERLRHSAIQQTAPSPNECRAALREIYDMTAPILLDEQDAFMELQHEMRRTPSDGAGDDAWRKKLDVVAPLVGRVMGAGPGRCAHVAHYGHPDDLGREFPTLVHLSADRLERWVARSFPTVFELNLRGLNSDTPAVTIWIVLIASAPQQMLDNFRLRRDKMVQAVRLAERLGARLIGMGGLIGSFSGEGQILSDTFPSLGFTTGHAFSIVNLTQTARAAARQVGLEWSNAIVGIVGAGSSIGAGCAQLLARERPRRIILIDVPGQQALAAVAAAIRRIDSRIEIMCSYRVADVRTADLTLTVTSWPGFQVISEHLKPGAVVIDDAYPCNVPEQVARERPDVVAIDGRLVRLPSTIDVDLARALPDLADVPLQRMMTCREVVGCFAETVTLSATQNGVWNGLGRLDPARAVEIAARGTALGFEAAPLQFAGELVGQARFARAAAARRNGTAA